jgi:hypothetical protein
MERRQDIELQDLREFKLPETKYQSSSPRGEGVRRIESPRRLTVTPTENRLINENLELDNKIQNEYSCCCFPRPTDRRLLTFLSQLGLSTLVMIFCIYKLSVENSCPCSDNNQNTFYSSVLMTVLGIFLPSPRPLH